MAKHQVMEFKPGYLHISYYVALVGIIGQLQFPPESVLLNLIPQFGAGLYPSVLCAAP